MGYGWLFRPPTRGYMTASVDTSMLLIQWIGDRWSRCSWKGRPDGRVFWCPHHRRILQGKSSKGTQRPGRQTPIGWTSTKLVPEKPAAKRRFQYTYRAIRTRFWSGSHTRRCTQQESPPQCRLFPRDFRHSEDGGQVREISELCCPRNGAGAWLAAYAWCDARFQPVFFNS